jgi:hypothetical protein
VPLSVMPWPHAVKWRSFGLISREAGGKCGAHMVQVVHGYPERFRSVVVIANVNRNQKALPGTDILRVLGRWS